MARHESYDPKFVSIARVACNLGATDAELAEMLEVTRQTLSNWRNRYPEFAEAMTVGKAPADDRVERSLFQRALGYSHPEDDIKVIGGEIVITPTIKHYPPDTAACIFWLKNRRPDQYRANPEPVNSDDDLVITVTRAQKPQKTDDAQD